MAVIVPVGEGTATYVFQCEGIAKDMTFGFGVKPGPVSPASWDDFAQIMYDAVWDNGGSADEPVGPASDIGNSWTFLGVSIMQMTVDGPLVTELFDPHTGTSIQPTVPPNTALLMVKNTGLGGRKNKGRCYVPPFRGFEAAINNAGVYGSDDRVAQEIAWNAAIDYINAEGIQLLLHHSDGSAGTPIASVGFSSLVATQRRRLR